MSTRTAVVFRAIVADISDGGVSPERARRRQEGLHDHEDIGIEEHCDCDYGSFQLLAKDSDPDHQRSYHEEWLDEKSEEDEEGIERWRGIFLSPKNNGLP